MSIRKAVEYLCEDDMEEVASALCDAAAAEGGDFDGAARTLSCYYGLIARAYSFLTERREELIPVDWACLAEAAVRILTGDVALQVQILETLKRDPAAPKKELDKILKETKEWLDGL